MGEEGQRRTFIWCRTGDCSRKITTKIRERLNTALSGGQLLVAILALLVGIGLGAAATSYVDHSSSSQSSSQFTSEKTSYISTPGPTQTVTTATISTVPGPTQTITTASVSISISVSTTTQTTTSVSTSTTVQTTTQTSTFVTTAPPPSTYQVNGFVHMSSGYQPVQINFKCGTLNAISDPINGSGWYQATLPNEMTCQVTVNWTSYTIYPGNGVSGCSGDVFTQTVGAGSSTIREDWFC